MFDILLAEHCLLIHSSRVDWHFKWTEKQVGHGCKQFLITRAQMRSGPPEAHFHCNRYVPSIICCYSPGVIFLRTMKISRWHPNVVSGESERQLVCVDDDRGIWSGERRGSQALQLFSSVSRSIWLPDRYTLPLHSDTPQLCTDPPNASMNTYGACF